MRGSRQFSAGSRMLRSVAAVSILGIGGCAAAKTTLNIARARLTVVAFRHDTPIEFKTVPVESPARAIIKKLLADRRGWHRGTVVAARQFLFGFHSLEIAVAKGVVAKVASTRTGGQTALIHRLAPSAYARIASAVGAIPVLTPDENLPQPPSNGSPSLRFIRPIKLWTAVVSSRAGGKTYLLIGSTNGLESMKLSKNHRTGNLRIAVVRRLRLGMGSATAMLLGPRGRTVIAGFGGGWVFRCRIPSLRVVWYRKIFWRGGGCSGVYFPPKRDRVILTGCSGVPLNVEAQKFMPRGSIYVLDDRSGATIRRFGRTHPGSYYTGVAALGPDSVLVGFEPDQKYQHLLGFNYRSGRAVAVPRLGGNKGLYLARFVGDGRRRLLFTGQLAGRTVIGKLSVGRAGVRVRTTFSHSDLLSLELPLAVCGNGKVAATPGPKRSITLWNTRTLKVITKLRLEPLGRGMPTLCFTPRGRYVVALFMRNGAIFVWRVPAAARKVMAGR